MRTLVAFLEEPSAAVFLKTVLLPLLPPDWTLKCISFEGKQDLEKNLERKLRGWINPDSSFLVMRDRDSEDCRVVKNRLMGICRRAERPQTIVRIACGELESFYLGDLDAVSKALDCRVPSNRQAKFRDPDRLNNAADELKRLTRGTYQKISGSRMIGPYLKTDGTNRSHSFNVLLDGVRRLVSSFQQAEDVDKTHGSNHKMECVR